MPSLILIRITPQPPVEATDAAVTYDQILPESDFVGASEITPFRLSYDSANDGTPVSVSGCLREETVRLRNRGARF
jgi:hypothetical protein